MEQPSSVPKPPMPGQGAKVTVGPPPLPIAKAQEQPQESIPARKTILPDSLHKSLIFISGVLGIGKSMLAASLDIPDNIICLDFESKGELIHKQLGYGKYIDVIEMVSKSKSKFTWKPQDIFPEIEAAIAGIPKNRYTVMIMDNTDPFQDSLDAEVKAKAINYGLNPAKAASGQFGENWKGVNNLVANICQLAYSRGIRVIVIIAHVGHPWTSAGPDLRKWSVKGVKTFHRLSCLSLILTEGNPERGGKPDVPSALVMKESLALIKYDEEKEETVIRRRIPYRIPQATGKAIRDYVGTDESRWFDSSKPKEGEIATAEDWNPYRDNLTEQEWKEIQESAKVALEMARAAKEEAEAPAAEG